MSRDRILAYATPREEISRQYAGVRRVRFLMTRTLGWICASILLGWFYFIVVPFVVILAVSTLLGHPFYLQVEIYEMSFVLGFCAFGLFGWRKILKEDRRRLTAPDIPLDDGWRSSAKDRK